MHQFGYIIIYVVYICVIYLCACAFAWLHVGACTFEKSDSNLNLHIVDLVGKLYPKQNLNK